MRRACRIATVCATIYDKIAKGIVSDVTMKIPYFTGIDEGIAAKSAGKKVTIVDYEIISEDDGYAEVTDADFLKACTCKLKTKETEKENDSNQKTDIVPAGDSGTDMKHNTDEGVASDGEDSSSQEGKTKLNTDNAKSTSAPTGGGADEATPTETSKQSTKKNPKKESDK